MTDFKTIALAEIHPDPEQPRKFFDRASLDELTLSVKKDGVLEPIMIRPNGKGYIIVYGERRFKAATAAGLKEIPAQIRELTPDEAFEFQITENLHRKDVHPMEEANSYERLQKKDPVKNTIKELATRFAKSELYITQRLSFNNLIPEFQKDFFEGKFITGHAILFSRLTKDDQYLVKKEAKSGYTSVSHMADWIERQIVHNLSKAPFNQEDITINPAAGACSKCPKRSGSNQLLFPDVKEKDRCFDSKCFSLKAEVDFNRKLKEILETKPDVHLILNRHRDSNKAAVAFANEMKVKVLVEDEGFDDSSYGRFKKKAQGFWLNGWDQGKTITIYLPGATTVDKNGKKIAVPEKPAKEQIEDIQIRHKRSIELDAEKVWTNVKKLIEDPAKLTAVAWDSITTTPEERVSFAIAILNKINDVTYEKQAFKALGLKGTNYHWIEVEQVKKLAISDKQIVYLLRLFALCNLQQGLSPLTNKDCAALMPVLKLKNYLQADVGIIEAQQKEAADKRSARVKERITALQSELKTVKPKVATKPKSKTLPKNAKKKNAK